jgi:hypothetical protein
VAWNHAKLCYYQHMDRTLSAGPLELARWVPEYFAIWGGFWIRNFWKIPGMLWRSSAKTLEGVRFRKPTRSAHSRRL